MHPDDVATDALLVRRLLEEQFPHWADRPLEPVAETGTDNALYRLGPELVVRLPRRERPALTLEKETHWLPRLAPLLPLAVPLPVGTGEPADGYPFPWAVYRWLPGETASRAHVVDEGRLGRDLAHFVAALQRIDPADGPPPGQHNFFRGVPLAGREAATRAAIESLRGTVDIGAAIAAWERALGAPEWQRPPVWIHGDLDAQHLLVACGRLSGVIDFGGLGVGDPATDVMVAWKVLSEGAREVFRSALSVDDATWARGRGWGLSQSLVALARYTPETHPVLARDARCWLDAVLADTS